MKTKNKLNAFQIIGYSAGIPTSDRDVTSVLIFTDKLKIMIDCGEGTYKNYIKRGYKLSDLKYICITHMHPDHVGGLVNLLFYRKILNLSDPLILIGPDNLKDYIESAVMHHQFSINYEIKYLSNNNLNINADGITINTLKLKHKIDCYSYKFDDGEHSIVFATDTLPVPDIVDFAYNVTVLIHEATYASQHKKIAVEHFHTTVDQAFDIADKAKVKKLYLTHFSKRYKDEDLLNYYYNGEQSIVFDEKINI